MLSMSMRFSSKISNPQLCKNIHINSKLFQNIGANKLKLNLARRSAHEHHGAEIKHSHQHKPAGPYDVPHHPTYPEYEKAYPFGRKPGTPLGMEHYGAIIVMTVCSAIIFYVCWYPQESLRVWALKEAIERNKILEEGGEIEFGKYYHEHSGKYTVEEVDQMPVSVDRE